MTGFSLFIFVSSFTVFGFAQAQNLCADRGGSLDERDQAVLEQNVSRIQSYSETSDVSSTVSRFLNNIEIVARHRGISEEELIEQVLPGGRAELERLRQLGYQNGARSMVDVVELDAQMGGMSAALEELQRLAELGGLDASELLSEEDTEQLRSREERAIRFRRQDCSSVDHTDRLGPIRDQAGTDWCVSYVMADMLSFHLGTRVSAFDVARQNYNTGLPRTATEIVLDGGLREAAPRVAGIPHTRVIGAMGTGLLGLVAGIHWLKSRPNPRRIEESLDVAVRSAIGVLRAAQQGPGLCSEAELPSEDSGLGNVRCLIELLVERRADNPEACFDQEILAGMFPHRSAEQIRQAAHLATLDEAVAALSTQCAERVSTEQLGRLELSYLEPVPHHMGLVDVLQGRLENGPVAVGLSADVLDTSQFANDRSTNGHQVIIAGRRWNEETQICEMLIRNSWGEDFNGERAGWTPDPDRPGHAWISEQALRRNVRRGYTLSVDE